MLDPLPPPPSWLSTWIKPYSEALYLPSLPYHIHEVLGAFIIYQTTQSIVSPILSKSLFPQIYANLSRRTRVNWDVHVVSLLQSVLINTAALWVMFTDQERKDMNSSAVERIYGYTGAAGMIQALATGYFIWDLVVSARYLKIFGPGILAHAVTALSVFSLGFRPFCNYYGPVFILYELSTPFLNIHWFCDKLNMTGGKLQWYNGIVLLAVFFGCRLIWGTYQSLRVYQDVWHTMHLKVQPGPVLREIPSSATSSIFTPRNGELCLGAQSCLKAQSEVMQFASPLQTQAIPIWLALIYLSCNLTLNTLNFFWFGKMIETVRKRFEGKPHDEYPREREEAGGREGGGQRVDRRRQSYVEYAASELDYDTLSGPKTPYYEKENQFEKAAEVSAKSTAVPEGGSGEIKKR